LPGAVFNAFNDRAWYSDIAAWSISVAASLSTTIFELVPLRITKKLTINDNLAVPVITGGVIYLVEWYIFRVYG